MSRSNGQGNDVNLWASPFVSLLDLQSSLAETKRRGKYCDAARSNRLPLSGRRHVKICQKTYALFYLYVRYFTLNKDFLKTIRVVAMLQQQEVLVDPELKEMVVNTLDASGSLANIRAQLRASVYLALEGQKRVSAETSLIKNFMNTETGVLSIHLVRDLLKNTGMHYTLSVFDSESGLGSPSLTTPDNLPDTIGGLNFNEPHDTPLLLQVVKGFTVQRNSSVDFKANEA